MEILLTDEIHLDILAARRFDFSVEDIKRHTLVPRRCYNYEMEYYTSPKAGILVDGEYVEFQSGDVNFRTPGQVLCGIPSYRGYTICFALRKQISHTEPYFWGSEQTAEPAYQNPVLRCLPIKVSFGQDKAVQQLFSAICTSFQRGMEQDRFKACVCTLQLLTLLMETAEHTEAYYCPPAVQKAEHYLKKHYLEELSIDALIQKSGLSKGYFHKCFKSFFHTTPAGLVILLRMDQAKALLKMTNQNVAEIAAACGYFDSAYFSRLFKKHTGKTPLEFRNQQY
ncbi:MAG: AraC family transcriptional regulator [Ruthenibacterium sp.]